MARMKQAEWIRRSDTTFFSLPAEYREPMEFEEEDKLMLARLFIDSFKVLTYLEFTAIQALLLIQSIWDESADAPTEIGGGYFSTHDSRPLDFQTIHNVLSVDAGKLIALTKSALKKLPILETMIDKRLMKQIREFPEPLAYTETLETSVSQEMLKFLGKTINTTTKREDGILIERDKSE